MAERTMRVRHSNGYEGVAPEGVAKAWEQRGHAKILGVAGEPERKAGKPEKSAEQKDRDEAKLADLREQLKAEEKKGQPNENSIRAFKAQIERLEA